MLLLLIPWMMSECALTALAVELWEVLRADIQSKFPTNFHLEDEYRRFLVTQTHHPSNFVLELSPSCDWTCHQELKRVLGSEHYDFVHQQFALVMKKQYASLEDMLSGHSEVLRVLPLLPEMKIDPSIDTLVSSCSDPVRTLRISLVSLTEIEFHQLEQRVLSYTLDHPQIRSTFHLDSSEFRPGSATRCISAKVSCSAASQVIHFLTAQPEVLFIDEKM